MGKEATRRWLGGLLIGLVIGVFQDGVAQDLRTFDPNQPVALVADQIEYDSASGQVTASGSVEVYYGDRTLTADRIVYDDKTGRISAIGDITLRDPTGVTVYASMADLDAELRDGIVQGARSYLGGTAKLAAVEARRYDNRYNTLSKAVYSPCRVCSDNPTPLWRIRAKRVIHDEEKKVIHYENAYFDLFGVPVGWTPYFRHPDPTVDRASGFLSPSFLSSSNYGYGAKVPYFIVIDDQSDLTVTPFFTTDEYPILISEYRRAFDAGLLRLGGSVSFNDYDGRDDIRGHVDSSGRFGLGAGVDWGFNVNIASDDSYLRHFDLSNQDRLTSRLFVERYRPQDYFEIDSVYFQSLRDNEPSGNIPLVLPQIDGRIDFNNALLGGDLGLFTSSNTLLRDNGRDAFRFSLGADWERQIILPIGLALRGFGELRGDIFHMRDDPSLGHETRARFAPLAGVEARYPLIWSQENGNAHIIEPMAQAIVAPFGGNDADIPVEDSLTTEFDELNLFDTNHFSGLDSVEEGPRFNLGLSYEFIGTNGINFDANIGRVYRFDEVPAFSAGSGLQGTESDIVAGWSVSYDPYVIIRHHLRLDDGLTLRRNEIAGQVNLGPVSLEAGYIFLESDPAIGAPFDRQEVSARTRIALTDNWSISGFMQRDMQNNEFVKAGGGIGFHNECCAIDVVLRRRFTDSNDVQASTTVGVQVQLFTLGANNDDQERENFYDPK